MPEHNITYDPMKEKGDGISIYFDPQTLAALDAYAEANRRTRSWMVRELVRNALGIQTPPPDNQQGERH